jgi:hypothetical protein
MDTKISSIFSDVAGVSYLTSLKIKMTFGWRCYWIKDRTVPHIGDTFNYCFWSGKVFL